MPLPELTEVEYPLFARSDDERQRWRVCLGLAMQMTGGDDPAGEALAARVLYASSIPTAARSDATVVEESLKHDVTGELRDRVGRWIQTKEVDQVGIDGSKLTLHLPTGRPSGPPPITEAQLADAGLDKSPKKGLKAIEILGDVYDTKQLHSGEPGEGRPGHGLPSKGYEEWQYSEARLKLHDTLVEALLAGHKPQETPHVLFMAGGPASGKTTLLKLNPWLKPPDAVMIDADEIKKFLGEYNEMIDAHDRYAATAAHSESGDIAEKAVQEAIRRKLNLVIDGTGNHETGAFEKNLNRMKNEGYLVDVKYMTIPTEEAVLGNLDRMADPTSDGRFVPIPKVRDLHARVSRRFPAIAKLPFLNSLEVYGQDGHLATLGDDDQMDVLHQKGYAGFLDQAKEISDEQDARVSRRRD